MSDSRDKKTDVDSHSEKPNLEGTENTFVQIKPVPSSTSAATFLFRLIPTWSFVRAFGELTILTRASYLMLAVVPLLAAVWPSVRALINRYNTSLIEQRARIEASIEHLETFSLDMDTLAQASEAAMVLQRQLSELDQSLFDQTIVSENLPLIWAVAWCGALFAAIANTVYQTVSPSLVKESKLDEYIAEQLQRHREHPGSSVLKTSITGLAMYSMRADYVFMPISIRAGLLDTRLSGIKYLEIDPMTGLARPLVSRDDPISIARRGAGDSIEIQETVTVEAGAKVKYVINTYRNGIARFSASILYIAAFLSILYVLFVQAETIREAAGFETWASLLF